MSLKDKKIIRVEPVVPAFTVNWNLGLRCNFDCMYCPKEYHNLTDADSSYKELQTKWQTIYNKTRSQGLKYKITFTGGEVTINKSFLPFLKWLDETYGDEIIECGFTTNGSASKKFYHEAVNISIITFISLSTHSEFFNEHKFFDIVTTLAEEGKQLGKSIHVNVMDEYWNQTKIAQYCEFLTKNNINHSLNRIDYSAKIRDNNLPNKNKREYKFD